MSRSASAVLALVLLVTAAAAAAAGDVAFRGGRVLTLAGPAIEKGTVLVRDGRIVAVGDVAAVEVPESATVVDTTGRVLMPAWVEAHTSRCLDRPNERVQMVPFLDVADAIDPDHLTIHQFRRDGVGTVGVFQGDATQIGGRAVVIHPIGIEVNRMVAMRDAALKISMAPASNGSRMEPAAAIRDALRDAKAIADERAKARAEKKPLPDVDPKKAALVALVERRMRAFISCPAAMDVPRALRLIEQFGLEAVLVVGGDAHKAAAMIAKAKVPVVLDPALEHVETVDAKEILTEVAGAFHRAGVRFALGTQPASLGTGEPWFQMAHAIRQGVPRDVALAAMTSTAADCLGVGDRVGTIEVGKDGTLLLLTGDPLDFRANVDRLWIRGELAYERAKDRRLGDLLEAPKSDPTK